MNILGAQGRLGDPQEAQESSEKRARTQGSRREPSGAHGEPKRVQGSTGQAQEDPPVIDHLRRIPLFVDFAKPPLGSVVSQRDHQKRGPPVISETGPPFPRSSAVFEKCTPPFFTRFSASRRSFLLQILTGLVFFKVPAVPP